MSASKPRTARQHVEHVATLMGWTVTDTLLNRYMTDSVIHQLIDAVCLMSEALEPGSE